jgi:hypothetical protein
MALVDNDICAETNTECHHRKRKLTVGERFRWHFNKRSQSQPTEKMISSTFNPATTSPAEMKLG